MEVVTNQWKEIENEVEEAGLQRRRSLKRSSSSSSSSSDNDIEGSAVDQANEFSGLKDGGLDFSESESKEKFDFRTDPISIQVNAEMILQNGDTGKSLILPVSDPPIPEGSISVINVTNETGIVGIMKETEQERQELYLERVFQKPPTHGFYCPNCRTCIEKVLIQKGEWEQISTPAQPLQSTGQSLQPAGQPLQPTDTIRCSSCFSFLIPIGSWLFPSLVPKEDGASNDQVTGSPNNYREDQSDQTPKVASQYKAPQPDQSVEASQSVASQYKAPQPDQSVAKNTSTLAINIANNSGKQALQHKEVDINGAQKVASKVEDKINGTGVGSTNNMKLEDSSNHFGAISQDCRNGEVASTTKKPFGGDWAVIGDASEVFMPKQPEIDSLENGDWGIIATAQDAITKQPDIDILVKLDKQPQFDLDVKVDGRYTGPAEPAVPDEIIPLLTNRRPQPPVAQEPESSKKWEILKSIVYGGLTESLASLSVVTSAASADATTLNIVALAIANLIGGLFVLGHNLGELKAEQPRRAENQTDAPVDRYNESLGQRDNFYLHAFVAILSFLIFGLVPPVVYGFSFHESDDKDFKLAAVAGASLLCITLLSIAKAHIQKPNSYVTYLQTVLYYVSTGAVASVLSYVAGDLVKKLVEKLGWFESTSNFALHVPGMRTEKPGWGSY